MLKKNAQVKFFGLMLGLTMIILALALAFPVKQGIDNARNTTLSNGEPGLDCTNSSISNFNKATCVVSDISLFYFLGSILFIAGSIITARIIFG